MSFSPEDAEHYWKEGFVLLEGLFSPDAVARFEARFIGLALGRSSVGDRTVVMRDVMIAKGIVEPKTPLHAINKLLSFEDDPVLFDYTLNDALLAAARALIGPDLLTISTNVFNKPPGVDGRHPFHQDLRYFTLRPADKIVASWTAISETTRNNGCLAVLPGSHLGPLLPHGTPDWDYVNGGFFAAEGADYSARVHVDMRPGDTLLFHPLLLHGSGRNRSDDFRRAISTHFASVECERPEGPRKREPVTRRIA